MEVQRLEGLKTIGHLHDGVIYYYDQNPSGFCFLVQIQLALLLFQPRWDYQI